MNSSHKVDLEFKYASPFLKKILVQYASDFSKTACLDIPCGNGRNTFLLAKYFQTITAIDIDKECLNAINDAITAYPYKNTITTLHGDLMIPDAIDPNPYQFICNIHFFEYVLTEHIISSMNKGSFFLMETPTCHGENFRSLPNEEELKALFVGRSVLHYDFRLCGHAENNDARGSIKALIQI